MQWNKSRTFRYNNTYINTVPKYFHAITLHKIPPQEKLANRSVSIFTPVFNLFKKVSILHNSPITNSKFKSFEKKQQQQLLQKRRLSPHYKYGMAAQLTRTVLLVFQNKWGYYNLANRNDLKNIYGPHWFFFINLLVDIQLILLVLDWTNSIYVVFES